MISFATLQLFIFMNESAAIVLKHELDKVYKKIFQRFLKFAQAGANLVSFGFFIYFLSQQQRLRPLSNCAPSA